MYADKITDSMRQTIDETNRRREKQLAYNEANGITPRQIRRSHTNILLENQEAKAGQGKKAKEYADMPDGLMMLPTRLWNTCRRISSNAVSTAPAS